MPALSTDERRALLAAQEAIETATDEQLAAARAHERAKCDIAERAADRDLVMRTALRRLKLSPDEWEFKIETTSGKAEIRRKGQSA